MDPRTRIVLLACVGVLAVTLDHVASLGALALLTLLPLVALRIEGVWWRRGAMAVATIVWSTVLSQGLFYAQEPRVALATFGPLTLWAEGVRWGLVQSLRFVAVSLAGIGLAVSTPPDRLFAALLRLRVPFGLAFLGVTALRFVPEITREWLTVRQARARRGRPAWRRPPWAWLALEVRLLRPVVARTLRRARALAESMDARGFDPSAPRTVRRPLRWARWEPPFVALSIAVTSGVVCLRIGYLLYTTDVLYVGAWRPVYGFVRTWL